MHCYPPELPYTILNTLEEYNINNLYQEKELVFIKISHSIFNKTINKKRSEQQNFAQMIVASIIEEEEKIDHRSLLPELEPGVPTGKFHVATCDVKRIFGGIFKRIEKMEGLYY